jgi:membrane protein
MASFKERLASRLDRARARSAFFDHAVLTQEHYSRINGSAQAAAVTYFAFLSFFPILALSFFVVGYVARVYPAARDNLVSAIEQVLPGIVGSGKGEITLGSIQNAAATVGVIGLVGVIYSGLGWLSGMRSALEVTFELPARLQPSFVAGKLRDLATLVAIGVILLVSVAITGAVAGFSTRLLDLVGLGHGLAWVVEVFGPPIGLVANMVLFFALFRLLADPPTPKRRLWQGALLGAVGFEILKQASSYLIASTKHQPAFQAFGIALILIVWINYFSRLVVYAAAWAHTAGGRDLPVDSATARAATTAAATTSSERLPATAPTTAPAGVRRDPRVAFGAGAAAMLGLVAVLRRRRR